MMSTFLFSSQIKWQQDFDKAQSIAQKDNAIIYALVTSTTCKWCKKLKTTTLRKKSIVKRLHNAYVSVELTRNEEKYPEYLTAKMVPMNYFLAPDGRVLYSIPGFWNEEDFMSILDDVDRKYRRQKRHTSHTSH